MANILIPKRSSVAGKIPLATDLQPGEIAVNLADRKIYSKNTAGSVISLCDIGYSQSMIDALVNRIATLEAKVARLEQISAADGQIIIVS